MFMLAFGMLNSLLIKILSFLFLKPGASLAWPSQPPDLHASLLSVEDKTQKEKRKINLLFLKLNSPKCSSKSSIKVWLSPTQSGNKADPSPGHAL